VPKTHATISVQLSVEATGLVPAPDDNLRQVLVQTGEFARRHRSHHPPG